MENIRSGERNAQQSTSAMSISQVSNGAPVGFEGMNFEQQRGSYKRSGEGAYEEGDLGSPDQAGSVS